METLTPNPLYIPELLHHILDYLSGPLPPYDKVPAPSPMNERHEKRALAVLARTCRAFLEPSLDRLWCRLSSLLPLLRSVAAAEDVDHWRQRSPSLTEWNTIGRYSHRIRELLIADELSLTWLKHSIPKHNLFPNLRVLSLQRLRDPAVLIQPLLGPRLVYFSLYTDIDAPALPSFLTILSSSCQGLKAIDLNIRETVPHTPIAIDLSHTITSFKKLECFSARSPSSVDGASLQHIIMSPQINDLWLTCPQLHDLSFLPSDTPLSGVKSLYLRGIDVAAITGLLRTEGQGQSFSKVFLVFENPLTCGPTSSFLALLASEQRRSSLQILSLFREHGDAAILGPEEGDILHDLSYDTLRPLGLFGNLRLLHIVLENRIFLDDKQLADLAAGWPLLEDLQLDRMNALSSRRVTLEGLLSLIVTCPKLILVMLSLDAREVPTNGESAGPRGECVKQLHFPMSPICDSRQVAEFMKEHFPSLYYLCADGPGDPWNEKWEQVLDFLEV